MINLTPEQQAEVSASIDAMNIDFSHFVRRMRERGFVTTEEEA